jgi:cyclic pyranopterin phosphate synthase
MVDGAAKPETARCAVAACRIPMAAEASRTLREGRASKGDVEAAARIAGIQAAKRTADLIPLCHPLALTKVDIELEPDAEACAVDCRARVETIGRTGVEMEALTAASVALLTIYDMCKAIDRGMRIESIGLLEKRGGKSGDWQAPESA